MIDGIDRIAEAVKLAARQNGRREEREAVSDYLMEIAKKRHAASCDSQRGIELPYVK